MEDAMSDTSLAYHEAGHAVIGTLLGWQVEYVTTQHGSGHEPNGGVCVFDRKVDHLDIVVAGAAGEAVFSNRETDHYDAAGCWRVLKAGKCCEQDYRDALALTGDDEERARARFVAVLERVRRHKPQLVAVAEALDDSATLTLSGDQVRHLVAES
jgi:hypothetical protein